MDQQRGKPSGEQTKTADHPTGYPDNDDRLLVSHRVTSHLEPDQGDTTETVIAGVLCSHRSATLLITLYTGTFVLSIFIDENHGFHKNG